MSKDRTASRSEPILMRVIGPPIVAAVHAIQDVRVHGDSRLPQSGPLIVLCNHTCHLDGFTAAVALYQAGIPPRFAIKADVFDIPVVGPALRTLGQVPIYRPGVVTTPNGGSASSSIANLSQALDNGDCVVIFPESTFTRDPEKWPMKAKTGAARLILEHPEAKVFTLVHWGNEGLIDPWTHKVHWQRFGRRTTRLTVGFDEVKGISNFRDREVTHNLLVELSEYLMGAITSELSEIRAKDPQSRGKVPRAVRWDIDKDGDPFAAHDARNKARTLQRAERRKKVRKYGGTMAVLAASLVLPQAARRRHKKQ